MEISYAGRHLNEFSVGTQLLDYEALLDEFERRNPASTPVDPRSYRRFLTSRAVEAVHARGGLVSLNHVFGTGTVDATPGDRNAVLDALVGERLYGADLLEVGYRDRGGHGLADHLWVWDQLALAGLPAVGIGVSDSHGGSNARWRSAPNNFVSWIHAASPSKRDLIEGLRAGRVFFGDIVLFDGEVELTAPGGVRMGDTLVTSAAKVPVTVSIDGLEAGDRVHVVESGRRAAQHEVEGARFRIVHEVALPADGGGFVRVEVYGREGREKVFSNPIYLRASAEAGMP